MECYKWFLKKRKQLVSPIYQRKGHIYEGYTEDDNGIAVFETVDDALKFKKVLKNIKELTTVNRFVLMECECGDLEEPSKDWGEVFENTKMTRWIEVGDIDPIEVFEVKPINRESTVYKKEVLV